MDPLREAFSKIKKDILSLKKEIELIKATLNSFQTVNVKNPTHITQPTNQQTDTRTPNKNNLPLESLKTQNLDISTGNGGVPTDKPTNKPTDRHIESLGGIPSLNDFSEARLIKDKLDSVKESIKRKFRGLSNKEMLVFSTIYTLENEKFDEITHKILAEKLNLSESSIREYINKLIKKGIPLIKKRKNNKTITISISQDLKNTLSLDTILKIRGL